MADLPWPSARHCSPGIREAPTPGHRRLREHTYHDAGWQAIDAAGLTTITTLLRERSQLALPRLVGDGFVADTAFVDGSHLFHNVFVDLYLLGQRIRPGALVVLDDCHYPSVPTAVRYFEVDCGWLPQQLDRPTRLRAPTSSVERTFDEFLPFGTHDLEAQAHEVSSDS